MATKWGVVSVGPISHDFVTAVRSMPKGDHEFVGVAARDLENARTFAARHEIPKAYGSYEELAKDPDVEVAYIATVNATHFAVGKLMLENGKHVLMEKPMTLNVKQTKELIALARKHKRFLMEAIWSRFFPAYRCLTDLLNKNAVGDIVHVSANLGVSFPKMERAMTKALGRSTVLDVGVYTLNAVNIVYNGEKPEKIAAVGHLNEHGVDMAMTCSLAYSKNRTADVTANGLTEFPCDLVITGSRGIIRVPKNFWCPTVVEAPDQTYEFPLPDTVFPCNYVNSSGLRYEAMEVRECIKRGDLECSIMPLKDSEMLAGIMDEIRHQIGAVFDED